MFELAVFDMAGTTINDRDEVYRVLREATEREGAKYTDEQFQSFMGTEKYYAIGKLLEIGGVERTEEIHDRAWAWFREELRRAYTENPPVPLEGIEEALATLRENGVKVALTTGFSREIVDIILDSMGWEIGKTIDASAAGDEVVQGRPEPFLIQKVMADLGVEDCSKVISSGDTSADVQSARAAGVTSVGVLTGHLSTADFQSEGADHIIDSVAVIPSLILDQK